MLILFNTASLCGKLLSEARQDSNIRSIAGSLLSQYADQDVKHTSDRVAGIAQQILKHSSEFTQLARLAIEKAR